MEYRNFKTIMEILKKTYQTAFRRWLTGHSPGHQTIVPYIGADRNFVKQWISDRFLPGMTWDNYGPVWVVNYIVPLRLFDFANKEDLRIGLNYKNMIPLFKEDCLYKEGAVDFSLKAIEVLPVCEISIKLKSILLAETKRFNKYLPPAEPNKQEIIFLNSICYEIISDKVARISKSYELIAADTKFLTISSTDNNKNVKKIELKKLHMPLVRIDKNLIYVEIWTFTNEPDDNNHKRLNVAFANEMKRKGIKIPA